MEVGQGPNWSCSAKGKKCGWGVKLTTHLQLVPRSRKYGSIHPLPICFHGVVLNYLSTGTTLTFTLRSQSKIVLLSGLYGYPLLAERDITIRFRVMTSCWKFLTNGVTLKLMFLSLFSSVLEIVFNITSRGVAHINLYSCYNVVYRNV
jgi:hypothetical protein